MRARFSTLLFVAVLPLSGCSFFSSLNPFSSDEPAQPSQEPTANAAPVDNAAAPVTTTSTATPLRTTGPFNSPETSPSNHYVELLWQVPTEPVEAFRLSYGTTADKLDREIRIPIQSLQKLDDPAFGPVFSYQLTDVDPALPVYFSLRAENQGLLSAPSQTLKVTGEQITPPVEKK